MDKAALVSLDIERGREVLDALEREKKRTVAIALWVYLPEYEDWRLVLAARQFDSLDLREAYRLLHDSLAVAGLTAEKTPPVMILRMTIRSLESCVDTSGRPRVSKECVLVAK